MLVGVLHRAVGHAIRGRVVVYTFSAAALLVYAGSLAILEYERGTPDTQIDTFGKAVWWSFATITTVGYGDLTPVTAGGRVIAVLLMIGGISLVGSITATLASWIVQRVSDDDKANQTATVANIEQLQAQIRHLTDELRRDRQAHQPNGHRSEPVAAQLDRAPAPTL